MTLPNLLIIGAQKSGTSWLASMMRQRPEIFVHRGEIHYFNNDVNMARGVDWYEEHFVDAGDATWIAEKTPNYLPSSVSVGQPQRIRELLGDVKLIAVLRDPVERAISAYRHLLERGRVSPFVKIDKAFQRYMDEGHWIVHFGYYYRHVLDYITEFGADNLLVLAYEDAVKRDPMTGLRKVEAHLGLDHDFEYQSTGDRVNVSRQSRAYLMANHLAPIAPVQTVMRGADKLLRLPTSQARPEPETLERLTALYRPENERLFDLLGERFPWSL